MKYVRHNDWRGDPAGGVLVVEDVGTTFYVVRADNGDRRAVLKSDYHEVPEAWRDVTEDFTVAGGDYIVRKKDGQCLHDLDGHRLRKIRVADCQRHGDGYAYQDVFIVEQKQ